MKVGYKINGKAVSRTEFLKRRRSGAPQISRAWEQPKHCEALAVEPHRVKWQQMEDAELGLNTPYDEHGCPVFTSRRAYNEYVERHGYYMKNAGYGDVQPKHR